MTELGVGTVAGPGVAAGFELAGLRVREVEDREAAPAAVRALAAEPEIGLVLVQDDLVDDLLELEEELGREAGAVLVSFPGPTWVERAEAPREHVARILRRAVGYRVRL